MPHSLVKIPVFTRTSFIAAITAHIPNRGQKYTNYYGHYSSKSRGLRGDAVIHKKQSGEVKEQKMPTEEQRSYKKKWAQLIRKVFEVDLTDRDILMPSLAQGCAIK